MQILLIFLRLILLYQEIKLTNQFSGRNLPVPVNQQSTIIIEHIDCVETIDAVNLI